MRNYEGVFIFSPQATEESRTAILDKVKKIIESNGTVETQDDWGSRKLAYEINDFTDGYYTLLNFKSEGNVGSEIEGLCKITEDIIRHLVIRKED